MGATVSCVVLGKLILHTPALWLPLLPLALLQLRLRLPSLATKRPSRLLKRLLPRQLQIASAKSTPTTPPLGLLPSPTRRPTMQRTPRASTWSASWQGLQLMPAMSEPHQQSHLSHSLLVLPQTSAANLPRRVATCPMVANSVQLPIQARSASTPIPATSTSHLARTPRVQPSSLTSADTLRTATLVSPRCPTWQTYPASASLVAPWFSPILRSRRCPLRRPSPSRP